VAESAIVVSVPAAFEGKMKAVWASPSSFPEGEARRASHAQRMIITVQGLVVLLGMALFFGLAFENFFAHRPLRPGGIRTFPLLALTGAGCYVLEPRFGLIFAAGLAILGMWLFAYYRTAATDEQREFIVPVCNVLAYLIGALAVTQPPWVVVAVTVAATLLLAGRTRLHAIAQTVPIEEVFTAGQFLLLVGVALPLLPDVPIAGSVELTPHRILLAVVAVSALSYCSYVLTRYVRPKGATLLAALLGGLYSSTATTVVLARRSRDAAPDADVPTGIVLASAFMYLRLLAIVSVFDPSLGFMLASPLLALFVAGIAAAAVVYRLNAGPRTSNAPLAPPRNPLQLGAAVLFACLFVAITLATNFARAHYGRSGLDVLAAIVGFTDIDPFVLSVVQGSGNAAAAVAEAILIAAASNNVLKAVYAFAFGAKERMIQPILALLALAACSIGAVFLMNR
jgi:uncharacterized membrane protein (DUF4010 family)